MVFPSDLDFSQIIQRAYDESNNRLRVDAEISASIIAPPGLEVSINSADDNIAIRNSSNSNELLINSDGSIDVNATFPSSMSVTQGTSPWVVSGTVSVNPITFASPQHVIVDSGSLTANIGTTNGLALDSTVSGLLTNTQLRATPVPISGTISGSGNFTVVQPTGTNLHAVIDSGSITANAGTGTFQVNITNSTLAVTQSTSPWVISGTVTSNIGTTNGLALDASLTTLNTSVNTLLKPASTLTAVTTVGTITNPVTVSQSTAANLNATVVGTGTFAVQAAQSGTWNIGTVTSITNPVTISGTITANIGTTNGLALDASVTGLQVAQGSTTSGQSGPLVQTATTTSAPTYTTAKTNPLSTDTSGNLRVSLKDSPANTNKFLVTADPITFASAQSVNATLSAETTKVIGTVNISAAQTIAVTQATAASLNATVVGTGTFAVQAAQSGTWTVQPGNTANTTAWLVTGTGGTFPITDSGGSITVDNGGTFAVQATIAASATNIAKAEDSASADADVGVPALAVRKATPANTSGTDGDYEFLQMSAGRLWTSTTIDSAIPTGTNSIGQVTANAGSNLNTSSLNLESTQSAMSAKLPATLGQKAMTASMAVVLASDQTSIPVAATLSAETTKVIGTINVAAAQTIAVTQATGTNLHAVVDSGTITTVSTITNPVPTKEQPDATSTFSPTNTDSTAYETSRVIKASAGTLYSITGYNSFASDQFIQVHNTTSVPADTAVPVVIFLAKATSNFSYSSDKFGRFFSTGISVCNSSTGPTKTIGAANCWFNCQFT